MATIIGTQTSETPKDKTVTLKGEAVLNPADAALQIDIPIDHQAPTGRRLKVSWTVTILEEDNT